ncbi:MAG: TRAP transporter small permease [Thermodesulfobacteriota bacterium]
MSRSAKDPEQNPGADRNLSSGYEGKPSMSSIGKAIDCLNMVLRPAGTVLHSIGVGVLALMMFLTAADVILRYLFNRPIVGAFDLTEYMMTILISFGLAYCAMMKGHVTVDLIVSRLPQRVQAVIDCVTGLLSLGLFSLISWQCFVNVKLLYASGVTSTVLLIPVFPFVGVIGIGSAMLTLILLTDFLESLSRAVKK